MNLLRAFICFAMLTRLSTVDAMTPQILLSSNGGASDRHHKPRIPNRAIIGEECKSSLQNMEHRRRKINATLDTIYTSKALAMLRIWEQCRAVNQKFCRIQLLRSGIIQHSELHVVDWSRGHDIITTEYRCFPHICHEIDVLNSAELFLEGSKSYNNSDVYSISYCNEDLEYGIGFHVVLCICGILILFVIVGTLLDYCLSANSGTVGDMRQRSSVPGWRTLFTTPACEKLSKMNVPRIVISDTTDTHDAAHRGSMNSVHSEGCCSSRVPPIKMPSLSSIRSDKNNSISRCSTEILVHRSPSPASRFPRVSSLVNQGLSNKSQSFTDVSGVSASFGSVHETLNFSNPSVFVSPLQHSSQSDLGINLLGDFVKSSEQENSLERGCEEFVVPANNMNPFIHALINSSASRGLKRDYDEDRQRLSSAIYGNDSLAFVHSIQTIAVWWYHLYLTSIFLGTSELLDNFVDFKNSIMKLTFQLISNSFVHIHTVFFTSAIVLGYSTISRMRNTRTLTDGIINILTMFVTKYTQQFPFYILVILLWTYVIPNLGSGPMWLNLTKINDCANLWWTNLFYFNNFYPNKSILQCMPWTWFVAVEMQMYIFGLILVLLSSKFKRMTNFIGMGSVVIVTAICAFISRHHNLHLTPMAEINAESRNSSIKTHGGWQNSTFDSLFNKPYFYWSAYAVGTLVGASLKNNISFSKTTRVLMAVMYILSIPLLFASVFYVHIFEKLSVYPWNPLITNILYKLWILFLAPTVFCYRYSKLKGPFNKLLTLPCWNCIGQLNIPVMVVSPIILYVMFFAVDSVLHFSIFNLMVYFLASLSLTYFAVAIIMIFGHYPLYFMLRLVYLYARPGPQTKSKAQSNNTAKSDSFIYKDSKMRKRKRSKSRRTRRVGPRSLLDIKRSSFSSRSYQRSFESLFTPIART